MAGPLPPVRGPVRSAFEIVPLAHEPHTRAAFEAESAHEDKYRQRRARLMLADYDAGRPLRETPYPVQAVRLGKDLTILGLGGEVVVDYALRAKRELAGENLIVAGYCNDVMGYVPSRRVRLEGGYEAVESGIYYGLPGPFTPEVEETVFGALRRVADRVGLRWTTSSRQRRQNSP
jgi:hypothetical protein